MTNTSSAKKKASVLRSLAVAGFIAIICLIAWLSVQIVAIVPSTFSSLASLAEGITAYRDTIEETSEEVLAINLLQTTEEVLTGDSVSINWNLEYSVVTYSFMFSCVDGVSLTVIRADGGRAIECDTTYSLGADNTITLSAVSNVLDTTTVPYVVSFKRDGDTDAYRTGSGSFSVVTGAVAGESISEEEVAVEEPVAPSAPVVIQEPVIDFQLQIPVSNPNGFTDLATKFVNVGGDVDGRFVPGRLQKDSTGAFQFEVKNIGTKTSGNWQFTVALPNGENYTSETQLPLKPNERATLALSIDTDNDSTHTFVVAVTETSDTRLTNNSFSQRVPLVD